jgi:sterigmatocystin 8-O-methyltransferase
MPAQKINNAPISQIDDPTALSTAVTQAVNEFVERLKTIGEPLPNYSTRPIKDEQAQLAKYEVLRSCEKLMAAVQGPAEWIMFQNMSFIDPACIGIMVELDIPEAISPAGKPTTLDQLVKITGASKDVLGMDIRLPHLIIVLN